MSSNEYDDFSSFKIANTFEEYNEFYLKDSQLLPIIEVLSNDYEVKNLLTDEETFETFGWYKPFKVDLTELKKYIDIELIFR